MGKVWAREIFALEKGAFIVAGFNLFGMEARTLRALIHLASCTFRRTHDCILRKSHESDRKIRFVEPDRSPSTLVLHS